MFGVRALISVGMLDRAYFLPYTLEFVEIESLLQIDLGFDLGLTARVIQP